MSAITTIRTTHALLAGLTALAYVSGEAGIIHAWLGYGVAGVLAMRTGLAVLGNRQMGLMRFYPHFEGLKRDNVATHPAISNALILGIFIALLGTVGTGIALDKGRAIGLSQNLLIAQAYADEDDAEEERVQSELSGRQEGEGRKENRFLRHTHETFADLLMLLVGIHVTYLFLFKRPLVRFMLFLKPAQPPRMSGGTKQV